MYRIGNRKAEPLLVLALSLSVGSYQGREQRPECADNGDSDSRHARLAIRRLPATQAVAPNPIISTVLHEGDRA